MMPASNDLGATLTSPFLQFLLDMNTASSLFDLVISGPISASLANSLSTFAPAAKMLCEENRLRLCGLEKHVCEMIRRDVLGGIATCDTAFVPAGLSLRNFRCAFFDMDSTLIGNECIDELAALYDVKDQVAEITERSMRGELDFEHSLRERVKLLAGAPSSIINKAAALIRPTPGAKKRLPFSTRLVSRRTSPQAALRNLPKSSRETTACPVSFAIVWSLRTANSPERPQARPAVRYSTAQGNAVPWK